MNGPREPARGLHLLDVGLRWPPETFVQWKLQALAARGYRVTVASAVDRRGARTRVPGIELLRVPRWDEPRAMKLLGGLWDAGRLAVHDVEKLGRLVRSIRSRGHSWRDTAALVRRFASLARQRPDVVHFEWETAAVDHLALFDVWSCPVVVSCHGAGVNRQPLAARWQKLTQSFPEVFRRAAAVHCVADAVAERARDFGLEPEKARVIRTAVDPTVFRPVSRSDDSDEMRLVGVGRLIWSKGHEYALMTVARLLDQGVPSHYELIGGEPRPETGEVSQTPRILNAIEDLGLESRVRLCGDVPSAQVRAALGRADVFLHASLTEGLPTVIAEAMSCGLPVVVTDAGGTRELVRDGVDGFVVEPRDTEGLATAVRRLSEDPDLRRTMGRAGRQRIRTDFALEQLVDQFEALYSDVVGGGAPGLTWEPAAPGDLPPRTPPGNDRCRALRVLSAGRLTWRHGLEHAIHGVRLLRDRGIECEYRIAGSGDHEPAVSFARHQLGLQRAVTLLDPLDADGLRDELEWADIYLAPLVAPESTALAEAVASGVPAIVTDRAAPAGSDLSAGAAIEVPARDAEALAAALSELARETPRRRFPRSALRR